MDAHDQAFLALPKSLQRRIDSAFFSTIRAANPSSVEPQSKKRKLKQNPPPVSGGGFVAEDVQNSAGSGGGGGGFLVEDQDLSGSGGGGGFLVQDDEMQTHAAGDSGGGFLVDDDDDVNALGIRNSPGEVDAIQEDSRIEDEVSESRISLSDIPSALQLLDLPADDSQVLGIFRNAASGWDGASSGSDENMAVTMNDWRAVCTILLETPAESPSTYGGEGTDGGGEFVHMSTRSGTRELGDSSDVEMVSDANPDSDDDYAPEPSTTKSSRRTRTTRASTRGRSRANRARRSQPDFEESEVSEFDDDDSSGSQRLTSRQKASCLEAFALFFPDASAEELPKRKIMLEDINRTAKLLKEKIKAEEMLEMLEVFSTSPDKSMNLSDFERMMQAAKLV